MIEVLWRGDVTLGRGATEGRLPGLTIGAPLATARGRLVVGTRKEEDNPTQLNWARKRGGESSGREEEKAWSARLQIARPCPLTPYVSLCRQQEGQSQTQARCLMILVMSVSMRPC